MKITKGHILELDRYFIMYAKKLFVPFARVSLFVVFFWFGLLKLLGLSPAGPIAEALTAKTVGLEYFDVLFYGLAALECLIGVLFLVPRATRAALLLLFGHMVVVCSPLVLVPDHAWQGFAVPTLEGQYIIKNVVIVAVALGIASSLRPMKT